MVAILGFLHDDHDISEHEANLEDVFGLPIDERAEVARALSNQLYEVGIISEWIGKTLVPRKVIISGVTYTLGGMS